MSIPFIVKEQQYLRTADVKLHPLSKGFLLDIDIFNNISDTVDEAKETYVKNHLDLDDINENKHAEEAEEEKEQDPEAPPADSGATDGNGNGEAELVSPSAPDGDTSSHKSNDSPV